VNPENLVEMKLQQSINGTKKHEAYIDNVLNFGQPLRPFTFVMKLNLYK
jgi:hypothetical protein